MASPNKVFFDANVLIEIALERQNHKLAIDQLKISGSLSCASTLSAHLTIHFGKQRAALKDLQQLLSVFTLLDLTSEDISWAFENTRSDDFEDALQIAVAIRNGCGTFVTFDAKLAKLYNNLPTIKMQLLT